MWGRSSNQASARSSTPHSCTWSLHRAGETLEIDRLLVAAFLADVAAAYRFRGYRRLNSLLLLDGADLLDGIDSYLPPKRPRPAARAARTS